MIHHCRLDVLDCCWDKGGILLISAEPTSDKAVYYYLELNGGCLVDLDIGSGNADLVQWEALSQRSCRRQGCIQLRQNAICAVMVNPEYCVGDGHLDFWRSMLEGQCMKNGR